MFRKSGTETLYLLVHPGGPFFRNKDQGSWSIPKGLVGSDEDMLSAAIREFREETGIKPGEPFYPLGSIRQKGGKQVYAWAFELPGQYADWDVEKDLKSNTFELEWPPRSGKIRSFPEIDRAAWYNFQEASVKINFAQVPLIEKARYFALSKDSQTPPDD